MTISSLILLLIGFFVLASVFASKISDRFGVPAILVFVSIGMLAGEDGIGGIHFDNAEAANLLGTIALAFILFFGGLSTRWTIVRPVAFPGIVLSTVGVILTAVFVCLFTWLILGFSLISSMFLGAIISSTDAAAVFSILRSRNISLKGDLRPLLELESGSNDPMAVFLTLSIIQLLTVPDFGWENLILPFPINMGIGFLVGIAVGKTAAFLFNRIRLMHDGLYPVLSVSLILLTFGAAEELKGNGFLAVYLCGIMLNGTDFAFKRSIEKFHDGLAWFMQIILFLTLGLLVTPSHLPSIAPQGMLVALFLMLIARPAAVALCLWRSPFSIRERLLIAWAGLRGAVPIVLATFPLLAGYEESEFLFNTVFFIVLTSVLIQGTFLMPIARLLKVDEPLAMPPQYSLEIAREGRIQGETREIQVLPHMAIVDHAIADIVLPPDVLVLLIGRGDSFVIPRGKTLIEPYDTLLLFGEQHSLSQATEAVLSPIPARPRRLPEDPMATLPMSTETKYLSRQVVLVGYGNLGKRICETLEAHAIPFVVADQNRDIVESLRERGIPAVAGDASTPAVMVQTHVKNAAVLIITTPDALQSLQMIDIARTLNPKIDIIVRPQSEMEASLFRKEEIKHIMLADDVLAKNITDHIRRRVPD